MTKVFIVLGFLWGMAVICKLFFWKVLWKKREENRFDFVYQSRDFLSNAEMRFFQVLRQVCGSDYYIAPKVGLWALVRGEKTEYGKEKGWSKISQGRLDFFLLNSDLMKPILVVELDDSSHWRSDRREKDAEKDYVLGQVNIPVLRVPVRASYDVDQLKDSVYSTIRSFYRMDRA